MRLFSAAPFVLLASLAAGAQAVAEPMQMPAEANAPQQAAAPMEMPLKGMSMEQVRQMYGSPREVMPAVGQPPITRWVYDAYTVYFEYSHVIHSVPNH